MSEKSGLMMPGKITFTGNLRTKKTIRRINQLIKDIERNGVWRESVNPNR